MAAALHVRDLGVEAGDELVEQEANSSAGPMGRADDQSTTEVSGTGMPSPSNPHQSN
jgi:hypothetical protein